MAERIIKRIYNPEDSTSKGPTVIPKRRVAAYVRVSTASDEQLNSIAAQKDYFERMIRHHPDWILVDIYADEGLSGTSICRREGFSRMIADALDGKIDLIITKSLSRFARNTVDTLNTIRQLKEHGVEVFFERENILTMDSTGEFLITLLASFAEEESRSISENVKWGVRRGFANGKYHLPYKIFLGYQKGPNGLPQIVPEEARIIRWIYYLFLEGNPPSTIAAILTTAGIPAPGGKSKWYYSTVIDILKNEKHYGAARLQKEYISDFRTKKKVTNKGEVPMYFIENDHEGIITKEVFDEVQRRLKHPIRAAHAHTLFANQVFCCECGDKYVPRRWHSTTYNDVVWKCNSKCLHGSKCTTPHIYQDLLIAAFRDVVCMLLQENPDVLQDCLDALSNVTDISGIAGITAADVIPVGYPTPTERSTWRMIVSKVVVHTDSALKFHIIDGAEISYAMGYTIRGLRRFPPQEKAAIIEAYHNGVPIRILAERYDCSPNTIRTIIRRAKAAQNQVDAQ